MPDIFERAKDIRLVIFDVDGVLTDGSLYLGDDGQEYKAFHSRDGLGITMLKHTGVELAVITGRTSKVVQIRMQSLGIEHVFQGYRDKIPAYEALKETLAIPDQQIAYVGDDLVDLPIMRRVGLAIAVADAHPMVQRQAHWRTDSPGGRGAGRDVCEFIMEAQGNFGPMTERFFENP